MIARINAAKENDKGFTLIELLVVIIIIGILSAIAIPLFLNQQKKAQDAAAKADVSTIGKEIATYFVDWDGKTLPVIAAANNKYSIAAGAGTATNIGNQSKNVVLTGFKGTKADDWCVAVTNAEGDKATTANGGFSYSAQGGLQNAVCS